MYAVSGVVFSITLPFSEVCMYMHIAGKRARCILTEDRRAVAILQVDDKPFNTIPITPAEAGLSWDGFGWRIPGTDTLEDALSAVHTELSGL